MLILTKKGLYCPAGNFYIDPKSAVENAVITHAHSDHARKGSKQYFCTTTGVLLLKARLGNHIAVKTLPYRTPFELGPVKISFHPAGHILGSAQIRLEFAGEVWVVSGDYKRDADPSCEAFEQLSCDVFITEATFGTPAFRWNKSANVGNDIFAWWRENAAQDINSVILAYSLGKAQRILTLLSPLATKPIYCCPSTQLINDCYRAESVDLAPTLCLSEIPSGQRLRGDLAVVPPSFLQSNSNKVFGKNFKTAFASGWMSKSNHRFDKGFVISDHADWNDLLQTIQATNAKRVYVQHRGKGALVKKINSLGIKAFPDTDLIPKNPAQLALF